MLKFFENIIFCAVFSASLFISLPLFSAGSIGTSGADFLELGIGSRPLSMGEAFTAQTGDINSLYYNPAGLATLIYPLLSLQHQELILDSRLENVTAGRRIYGGYGAVSNTLFWVPPFDRIDIEGQKTGDVKFYNGVFTGGYARDFDFFYAGVSVKYVYQKIDNLFLHAFAVDAGFLKGFQVYSPYETVPENLHVGVSFLNFGTQAGLGAPEGNDPLPRMVRLGTSYQLTRWLGFNVDMVQSLIDTSDVYDFTYVFDESFRMSAGMEMRYLELLSFRAGYRFNDAGTYSLGLGFNYTIDNVNFNVDTSYSETGIFGPVYSINLTFKLIPRIVTVESREEAERRYREGIRQFMNGDLEGALREFRLCREYNPYYRNIDERIKDVEEIIRLREENIKLEQQLKERREKKGE